MNDDLLENYSFLTEAQNIGVTGNRPHKLPQFNSNNENIRKNIYEHMINILSIAHNSKSEYLIHGGAIGADLWSGLAALKIGLPQKIYRPFPNQQEGWNQKEILAYSNLLMNAHEIKTFGSEKNNKYYFERNTAIINDSDLIIAILSEGINSGGGYWTMNKAKEQGKPILHMEIMNDGNINFHQYI